MTYFLPTAVPTWPPVVVASADFVATQQPGSSTWPVSAPPRGPSVSIHPIKHEPVHEKTNNLGSNQIRHKLGCTVTEDG